MCAAALVSRCLGPLLLIEPGFHRQGIEAQLFPDVQGWQALTNQAINDATLHVEELDQVVHGEMARPLYGPQREQVCCAGLCILQLMGQGFHLFGHVFELPSEMA